MASVLALEPDIFVIDEPTSQLDPKETERVFDIIDKMKKMGKTIVLVEHKILALEEGRLIRYGEKHEVLSDLSLLARDIELPQSVILAHELREQGIELAENIITKAEMIQALHKVMSM